MDKEESNKKQLKKNYNEGYISVMIDKKTWKKLIGLKVHPRQTFREQIKELVDKVSK